MTVGLFKKQQQGYLVTIISIVVNVFLFVLKLWIGFISGSIALMADAWHTLSDSLSSIIVLICLRIANIPADKEHPFGHGRIEAVSSLMVASLLFVVAYNFGLDSVHNLLDHKRVGFGLLAIIITMVSAVVKELMAQYSIRKGKKYHLTSLVADGWHHRSDAISSLVILIGILFARYFWWIDGVLGFIVALLIAYTAYEIIKETTNSLLGESPSEELISRLKDIANHCTDIILNCHHFHIHKYGKHTEITFHLRLPGDTTVNRAHELVTIIENCIKDEMGIIATIHVEPQKK